MKSKIRRDVAARKQYHKFLGQEQSLLHHELVNPPPQRLKSRKPFYIDMVDEELDGDQLWRESWRTDPFPVRGYLVNTRELERELFTVHNLKLYF